MALEPLPQTMASVDYLCINFGDKALDIETARAIEERLRQERMWVSEELTHGNAETGEFPASASLWQKAPHPKRD